jgi:hypothetical protein
MLMVVHYVLLVVVGLLGLAGVGVAAAVRRVRARERLEGAHPAPALSGGGGRLGARPSAPLPTAGPAYARGDDLLRYPERLGQLEHQLSAAAREASDQADHLRVRRDKVAQKEDRAEIAERYDRDALMLSARVDNMRRVMALVWRTRGILLLRAHVAVTARRRPGLEDLPAGEIRSADLARAAEAYDAASDGVRRFVIEIEQRRGDLRLAVPAPLPGAAVTQDDKAAVAKELEHAEETYRALQNQMDRLADTLSYLGDRCHTRKVVEGASVTMAGETGTEDMLHEVNEALTALNDLSDFGDRALADSALENIAQDISALEATGLDLRAAAEAELEINKLLEQFPRA